MSITSQQLHPTENAPVAIAQAQSQPGHGGAKNHLSKWLSSQLSFITCGWQEIYCVGFKFLTDVVMKSTIFCDITPCSPFKVNRRFRRASSGSKNKPRKQREAGHCLLPAGFLRGLFFEPWRWRWHVLPKRTTRCYIPYDSIQEIHFLSRFIIRSSKGSIPL
jgi:hypothetical protein